MGCHQKKQLQNAQPGADIRVSYESRENGYSFGRKDARRDLGVITVCIGKEEKEGDDGEGCKSQSTAAVTMILL
ncbi:hypothetical protein HZ326_20521 [Fusarium oxysporum f. sp. albedinis]|nr:Uncharacterized protein HZ326_20587 [Fusarium oxysporum f. sp. albedinis]KAJ0136459.1 hypothetical protein HZ326_20521 [Fusarium oxysporum f. sp. albedinis]